MTEAHIPRMVSVNLLSKGQYEISTIAGTGELVIGRHVAAADGEGSELVIVGRLPVELLPLLNAFADTFAPFEQIQAQQTPTGALVETRQREDGKTDTIVTVTGVEGSVGAGGAGANGAAEA